MKNILLLSLLLIAACANPLPATTSTFKNEAEEKSKPIRARVADFIYPEVNHRYAVDPTPVVISTPYCYKTWDKPVCYYESQPGQDFRRVGTSSF